MKNDAVLIQVRDGHVAGEQTYVYCWFHPADGKIMYVGATWLHPAARAELHLNGNDPDSRAVGDNLEKAGIQRDTPLTMLAFPVPDGLERAPLRTLLIAALVKENMLSDTYFGFTPDLSVQAPNPAYTDRVNEIVSMLKER